MRPRMVLAWLYLSFLAVAGVLVALLSYSTSRWALILLTPVALFPFPPLVLMYTLMLILLTDYLLFATVRGATRTLGASDIVASLSTLPLAFVVAYIFFLAVRWLSMMS